MRMSERPACPPACPTERRVRRDQLVFAIDDGDAREWSSTCPDVTGPLPSPPNCHYHNEVDSDGAATGVVR